MKKDTKFRNKFLNNRPSHEIWGSKGGVSTMDPISTAIGIDILNKIISVEADIVDGV